MSEEQLIEKHDRLLENLSELMIEVGFGYRLTQQMNRGDLNKTQGRIAILSTRAQKLMSARKELIMIFEAILQLDKRVPEVMKLVHEKKADELLA